MAVVSSITVCFRTKIAIESGLLLACFWPNRFRELLIMSLREVPFTIINDAMGTLSPAASSVLLLSVQVVVNASIYIFVSHRKWYQLWWEKNLPSFRTEQK